MNKVRSVASSYLAVATLLLIHATAVDGAIIINQELRPELGFVEIFDFGDLSGEITDIGISGTWTDGSNGVSYIDDLVLLLVDKDDYINGIDATDGLKTAIFVGSQYTNDPTTPDDYDTIKFASIENGFSTVRFQNAVTFADNYVNTVWTQTGSGPAGQNGTENGNTNSGTFTMSVAGGIDLSTGSALSGGWNDASNLKGYVGHGFYGLDADRNATWNATFTFATAGGSSAVPEPGTATIFALGAICIVVLRRRRR